MARGAFHTVNKPGVDPFSFEALAKPFALRANLAGMLNRYAGARQSDRLVEAFPACVQLVAGTV
jgi:hypothetical protein